MQFEITTQIEAPAETVWGIITDGEQLTEWDSGITRFEGTIAPGETIRLWSEADSDRSFKLKVVRFTPPRQMVWKGGIPLGLFTGERTYTLSESAETTTFTMREEFSGLMAPLITKSIPDLNPSFRTYAAGLKARAESTKEAR